MKPATTAHKFSVEFCTAQPVFPPPTLFAFLSLFSSNHPCSAEEQLLKTEHTLFVFLIFFSSQIVIHLKTAVLGYMNKSAQITSKSQGCKMIPVSHLPACC